jgi:hypothetical protein
VLSEQEAVGLEPEQVQGQGLPWEQEAGAQELEAQPWEPEPGVVEPEQAGVRALPSEQEVAEQEPEAEVVGAYTQPWLKRHQL